MTWSHVAPAMTAAFLASLVECVEALTVVLAVGSVRGWRSALTGAGAGVVVLLALVALFGPLLSLIPLDLLRIGVGALLLLFGMRWLRKAVLRAARVIPLHDEHEAFAKQTETMRAAGGLKRGIDRIGFATAFQITMLEGLEVVFVVVGVGAGGIGLMLPAALAAFGALLVVAVLGLIVHRPLARVPENALKFVVGVLLTAFGSFWLGEGMGVQWRGGDLSILALVAGFSGVAGLSVQFCVKAARRKLARS